MPKDTQALRPEFFANLPTFIKEKQAKELGISDEEMLLFSLSQTAAWRELKKYIDGLLVELDAATEMGMAQGLPMEEIGKNAVVANLAKGVIKRILSKVSDAREAGDGGAK